MHEDYCFTGSTAHTIMDSQHQQAEHGGSINFKPDKPEKYDGKRDYLIVNTWLYQLEQYFNLLQFSIPDREITDTSKITLASTLLISIAAVWWFTLVQTNSIPTMWEDFKQLIMSEFIPSHHVRMARDKLRKLKQTHSVSKYLSEFRNTILTIPDFTEG